MAGQVDGDVGQRHALHRHQRCLAFGQQHVGQGNLRRADLQRLRPVATGGLPVHAELGIELAAKCRQQELADIFGRHVERPGRDAGRQLRGLVGGGAFKADAGRRGRARWCLNLSLGLGQRWAGGFGARLVDGLLKHFGLHLRALGRRIEPQRATELQRRRGGKRQGNRRGVKRYAAEPYLRRRCQRFVEPVDAPVAHRYLGHLYFPGCAGRRGLGSSAAGRWHYWHRLRGLLCLRLLFGII